MFNPNARLASQWQCGILMLQQRGLCASCAQPLTDKFEAHHQQPYSEGGATALPNLELLCLPCHRAKHSKR
jgi:5-methylcytosine-specific restriction endonuclease McrA